MDYIRTPYIARMQFDAAGTIKANVQWYFADPNAPLFTGPHTFGSSNWEDPERQGFGLGEQWDSSFKRVSGAAPFPFQNSGQMCGTADQFANGVAAGTSPIRYSSGVPTCCMKTVGPRCQPFNINTLNAAMIMTNAPGFPVLHTFLVSAGKALMTGGGTAGATLFGSSLTICPSGTWCVFNIEGPGLSGLPLAIPVSYDQVGQIGTYVLEKPALGPPGFQAFLYLPQM